MNTRKTRFSLWMGLALLPLPVVQTACSSDSSTQVSVPPADDASKYLAIGCTDSKDAVYQLPDGLSPYDAARRGDVLRCSFVATYGAEQLGQAAKTLGYTGELIKSGAMAWRFSYRTERIRRTDGTTPGGVTSATLFLPAKPRAAEGSLPLVVVARGSIGAAERCAPSRGDLLTPGDHLDDYRALVLPLVAAGWAVVAPDFPGYGYGETSGYMLAEDEAHGLLDATRAVGKMLKPGLLSDKVIIAGHSQGGHAALSAQAYAGSYGLQGKLAGVATMAPMWFTQLIWGGALSPVAGLTTAENAYTLEYAMGYFYTHAENYDGPGQGTSMFQPDKRDKVVAIETQDCLFEAAEHMPSLGSTPGDFFDPDFVKKVGLCGIAGATSQACKAEPAATWIERFKKDRPAIDPHGAPILIWQGGEDTTITPGFAMCALERLHADLANAPDATASLTFCVDPTARHSGFVNDPGVDLSAGITRRSMDWVDQWIAARTLGTEEPGACAGVEALTTDAGAPTCTVPPPNQ